MWSSVSKGHCHVPCLAANPARIALATDFRRLVWLLARTRKHAPCVMCFPVLVSRARALSISAIDVVSLFDSRTNECEILSKRCAQASLLYKLEFRDGRHRQARSRALRIQRRLCPVPLGTIQIRIDASSLFSGGTETFYSIMGTRRDSKDRVIGSSRSFKAQDYVPQAERDNLVVLIGIQGWGMNNLRNKTFLGDAIGG